MKGGFLDAAISGTIVTAPELKRSAKGTPYLRLVVAVGDGDARQFVTVCVFGDMAEDIATKAEKGGRITAEGALTSSIYERQGKPSVSLDLAARHAHVPGIGRHRPKRQDGAAPHSDRRGSSYTRTDGQRQHRGFGEDSLPF